MSDLQEQTISIRVDETVRAVRARIDFAPKVAVILGSGLGAFVDSLRDVKKISYGDLPHLPVSTIIGHAGNLCFGFIEDVPVVAMQGRVHRYEGHPIWQVVHGARVMARLGVGSVLVTNAAGGLEPSWAAGDLMVITDHLNLMGENPLTGPNDNALGTRFPDMSNAYDAELRAQVLAVGKAKNITLREGVYAGLSGPSYETPAEIRMLATLGAQAVGMSTVPEIIALRHMRVRAAALSCITNLAAGISKGELNHAEVEETARARRADLETLLRGWILAAGKS